MKTDIHDSCKPCASKEHVELIAKLRYTIVLLRE